VHIKIMREVLEGYLNCKTKGRLKLAGEPGDKSDYEAMTEEAGRAARERTIAKLVARFGEGDCRGAAVTAATLKEGKTLLADTDIEGEGLSVRFDAVMRVDGPSKLGAHRYLPVLHHHEEKAGRRQKLMLALFGLVLGHLQGQPPAIGLVARGPGARLGKVRLDAQLYRQAELVMAEVRRLQEKGEPPRLTLNGHCQACEYRQRCRKQAEEADDISLLGGIGEKELKRYHRKGIFTLTQLSCTFRPRKRRKRVKRQVSGRSAALQALAIREKKVHVYGTPDLPHKPVQVFLDAEGNEDGSFVYLLGVLVVEGEAQKRHSFWADSPAEELQAFDAFMDLLEGCGDFALFHYGSYERKLLKRMGEVVARKGLADRALAKAVNVLSAIHACVYFPTYSNGLKEVGRYLGCTWADENSSGLQSLVWRAHWEQTREPIWKEKLFTYNNEDCAALKKVAAFVQAVGEAARRRDEAASTPADAPAVTWADEVTRPSNRREFCQAKFALQEFDHVNQCAYFDYQREKVFLRTSKAVRQACVLHRKKWAYLPATREVESRDDACPACGGKRLTRLPQQARAKVAYDLEFTRAGMRRRVIRCKAFWHRCEDCQAEFLPERHRRRDQHLHGLKSWAMYQHVMHRVNFAQLHRMLEDCFGLRVSRSEFHGIRALMANRYRKTCDRILGRIVSGGLAHADETEVDLNRAKGYVWVLANLEVFV
jgi:predicted RecB family nuclease